jgi:hypothetical protein
MQASLHAVPEMVCVEEAIELGIQIDDIDASLCSIPNNGTRKVASVVVLFSINTQTAVNTKFQSVAVSFLSLLKSSMDARLTQLRPQPCSPHSPTHHPAHPTSATVS